MIVSLLEDTIAALTLKSAIQALMVFHSILLL